MRGNSTRSGRDASLQLSRALVVGIAFFAGTSMALGQNALGDGRGLEANSRVGSSSSNYSRGDFATEVRLRNAVVTGNLAGGRSLQTSVGYADPNDFRVTLPSESLFRFRRDSYSAGALGLRGTEGLQYQYAQSTGNAIFNRGGTYTGTNAASLMTSSSSWMAKQDEVILGSEESGLRLGTLRSTAAFSTTRSMAPALVGFQRTGLQMQRLTASGLLGVRREIVDTTALQAAAAAQMDRTAPKPTAPNALNTQATNAQANNAIDASAPVDAPRSAYDDLIERIAQRLATPAETPATGQKPETPGSDSSQRPNQGSNPASSTPGTSTPSGANSTGASTSGSGASGVASVPSLGSQRPWETHIDRLRRDMARNYAAPSGATPTTKDTSTQQKDPSTGEVVSQHVMQMDPAVAAAIRESGSTSRTFITGSAKPGDVFGGYMREAETFMAQLRFFDAEEHFARALSSRPGDVNAMIGRVHAQLGAGLLMSGAMNLRLVFEHHPETISQRWIGTAFPAEERMIALIADLRRSVEESRKMKLSPPAETGVIMAYVGFQRNNTQFMKDGLAAMHEAAKATGKQGDPLASVLEQIWLGTSAPAPTPTPAPTPSPTPAPVDPSK